MDGKQVDSLASSTCFLCETSLNDLVEKNGPSFFCPKVLAKSFHRCFSFQRAAFETSAKNLTSLSRPQGQPATKNFAPVGSGNGKSHVNEVPRKGRRLKPLPSSMLWTMQVCYWCPAWPEFFEKKPLRRCKATTSPRKFFVSLPTLSLRSQLGIS